MLPKLPTWHNPAQHTAILGHTHTYIDYTHTPLDIEIHTHAAPTHTNIYIPSHIPLHAHTSNTPDTYRPAPPPIHSTPSPPLIFTVPKHPYTFIHFLFLLLYSPPFNLHLSLGPSPAPFLSDTPTPRPSYNLSFLCLQRITMRINKHTHRPYTPLFLPPSPSIPFALFLPSPTHTSTP